MVKVECLAQEHNTMSPARGEVKRTNHEATASATMQAKIEQFVFYLPYGSSVEVLDRLPENRKGLSKGKTGTLAVTGVISFL